MNKSIDGAALKIWRESRNMSLREMATLLGVNSPSTVNAWEGGQDIPGPAQLLLGMLIHGEMPFGAERTVVAGLGSQVREDIGAVEMTVEAFEECLRRARAAGFGSVTEWIADLVRAELGAKPDLETRRLGEGETLPERQAVVYETPKRGRK